MALTNYTANNLDLDTINGLYLNKNLTNNTSYMNTYNSFRQQGLDPNKAARQAYEKMFGTQSTLGNFEKGLGLANTAIGGLSSLTNMGLGIYGAIMAGKQFEQAKEQYEFEKGLINRNLENQGKLINSQVAAASTLAGLYAGKDNYATAKQNYINKNSVNASPIG